MRRTFDLALSFWNAEVPGSIRLFLLVIHDNIMHPMPREFKPTEMPCSYIQHRPGKLETVDSKSRIRVSTCACTCTVYM